jgi:hypothetical protein
MTNDEALRLLKEIHDVDLLNVESIAINPYLQALETAMKAIEYRKAKKPESDYVEFFAEGNNVRRKWYYTCPSCGNELKPDHDYCNCGQRILWEDENGNVAD